MKDLTFLAATHNRKKRDELLRILGPLGFRVVTADEAGVDFSDVEETGTTFLENARLKAHAGCQESAMPCVADDSGLEVTALHGAPGIYSARYAGEHGNDGKNNRKLLLELQDVPQPKRTARFVSAVCVVFPDGRELHTIGYCNGSIGFAPKGDGGFGYDPLFLPEKTPGKTMAELTAAEKDGISHRAAALAELAVQLQELL